MIFIELFVPANTLRPEQRQELARRVGSVSELTEGEGLHAGWAEVIGSLFQVVVHEPEIWVADQETVDPQGPPRYLVRVYVPAPWRKDMSAHMISYITKVISEVDGQPERFGTQPVVQVHVLGVSEGGIGLYGRATSSEEIVEMISAPYADELAAGRALVDPLCGVTVPLNDDAVTLELDGTLYAFCCADCREAFVRKREKEAARSR